MKYTNYLLLALLLACGFLFRGHLHISTNLLSLFASPEYVKKLDIADNLGYSKEMLIAVHGFTPDSQKKVREISKKLQKMRGILSVSSTIIPSQKVSRYFRKYYPLLADFNYKYQTQDEIRTLLQKLYNSQINSIFYTPINKNDPLNLFNLDLGKQMNVPHRSQFLRLGNYGYLIRVRTDVSPSQMKQAKVLYKKVHSVLDNYKGVVAFAPFFYTVENSATIKSDVKWLVALSSIALLFIYFLLLKNIKLLVQTLITLFSSMLFAGLISMMLFRDFNVLSLAFGMSITSVGIDYVLHYHFHNFYSTNKKIDKNVLYGFLTTITAFGIFSFIPIPLIAQISFFAVLSLSFVYLVFTFVFPYLRVPPYHAALADQTHGSKKVPSYIFMVASIVLLAYSALHLRVDTNIRDLDYNNTKLQNIEQLFKTQNTNHYKPVLLQALTQEKLLQELHALQKKAPQSYSLGMFVLDEKTCAKKVEELHKYDFKRLKNIINRQAEVIGFKKGYFNQAYDFTRHLPQCKSVDLNLFNSYGLGVYKQDRMFYTIALVKNPQEVLVSGVVSSLDVAKMFVKMADKMYLDLLYYASAVIALIFLLVILSVKKRFLYAINYIIFPSSLVLGYLSVFGTLNLMHLFSLIILIAIGIDFGIYMSNTKKEASTMLAIQYSLLSTFAGFGVLIFSSINALNSIGTVIAVGIVAIFIMIKMMR